MTDGESMASRRSTAAPILAVLVIVAVLAAYVTTYFLRSELAPVYVGLGSGLSGGGPTRGPDYRRYYATTFEATVFTPAAFVESLVRGALVEAAQDPEAAQLEYLERSYDDDL